MKGTIVHTLFYLREYFFPQGCGICGEALLAAADAYYGLCENCLAFFENALHGDERCCVCGKPLITEKQTCLSCRAEEGASFYSKEIVKLSTLFPYTGKYKALLGAYKFRKSLGVGNFLGRCLIRSLDDFASMGEAALVPVPPRPGKIKKQGWDQIEYLAGFLRKTYRPVPVHRCLKRLPSKSQKELNREERGTNLKGRILCTKKPPKNAIIFDDVVTTGATLNACAQALLEGGSEKVYGLCLFYD
jgi:ComF family protein